MVRSPPPPLPRSRTGFSGQYQATLSGEQIPGAVARLITDLRELNGWRERHGARLAEAEHRLQEIFISLQKLDITIIRAGERARTLIAAVGVAWIVITFGVGAWIALRPVAPPMVPQAPPATAAR